METTNHENRWLNPESDPILAPDAVQVWRASVSAEPARLSAWRRFLDESDLRRESTLRVESARSAFVTARGLLRWRLSRYLAVPARDLEFEVNSFGKPRLATGRIEGPGEGVHFNVSHSGDHVLVALSLGAEVGVDVERMRDRVDPLAIARRYFSPVETEALARLEGIELRTAFYRVWTCKEAYAKAKGSGLQISLASFDVELPVRGSARLVETRGCPEDAATWRLAELEVEPRSFAAVAVASRDARVNRYAAPDPVEIDESEAPDS